MFAYKMPHINFSPLSPNYVGLTLRNLDLFIHLKKKILSTKLKILKKITNQHSFPPDSHL